MKKNSNALCSYCCSPGSPKEDVDEAAAEHDGSPLNIALAAPTDDEFDDAPARVYPQDLEGYMWFPDVRQRRYRGGVLDASRFRVPSAYEVPREALCRCDFGHAAAVSARDPYSARWYEATHYKDAIGACTCECQFCRPQE
jgi:hypothetical protein